MSEQTIRAERLQDAGFINLRGDPADNAFRDAAETALGQPLPVEPNTMSMGEICICWLGPDEWLIVCALDASAATAARLADAVAQCHAAVNDVSGGNVLIRLVGGNTPDLLAKGCTLDFHPDVFGIGRCAQSGLGKAVVLFGKHDDEPTFDVIVRRSFSRYLVQWLQHAGREYGIEFA